MTNNKMVIDSTLKPIVTTLRKLHAEINDIDNDWEQCPEGGFDLDAINGFLSDYDRVAHVYCDLCQQLLKELKL